MEEAFCGPWGCPPHGSFVVGPKNLKIVCGSSDPPPAGPRATRIADPAAATSWNQAAYSVNSSSTSSTSRIGPEDRQPQRDGHQCPQCNRSFSTTIGLGVHIRRAHPEAANQRVRIAMKRVRWTEEETKMVVAEEASASIRGNVKFMNEHLIAAFEQRFGLDRLKGLRKKLTYKTLVQRKIQALRERIATMDSVSPLRGTEQHRRACRRLASLSHDTPVQAEGAALHHQQRLYINAVRELLAPAERVTTHEAGMLVNCARAFVDGEPITSGDCYRWLQKVFPNSSKGQETSLSQSRAKSVQCKPRPR
ncbi:hypothetical protein KM043_012392 [Ampulex compressa]|nr:hypothetical protein KM043_012392 [Ampulex compressa]